MGCLANGLPAHNRPPVTSFGTTLSCLLSSQVGIRGGDVKGRAHTQSRTKKAAFIIESSFMLMGAGTIATASPSNIFVQLQGGGYLMPRPPKRLLKRAT